MSESMGIITNSKLIIASFLNILPKSFGGAGLYQGLTLLTPDGELRLDPKRIVLRHIVSATSRVARHESLKVLT
jgi:hypothetical protein